MDSEQAAFFLRLLEIIGRPLRPGERALDFGCGNGTLAHALAAAGADADGCDFADQLGSGERLRVIEDPYRLPFPDDTFDVIVSSEVFEHVQDYETTLREIRRVLRPDGISLHRFPSRYTPFESHIFVPLATVIQARPWLLLWAKLGVRNQFQRGKPADEVAALNLRFLRNQTTYYTRREILRHVRGVFPDARLLSLEPLAAKHSKRGRWLYAVARRVRLVGFAHSELRGRTLLLR